MNNIFCFYLLYIAIGAVLTFWIGQTLRNSALSYLLALFAGNEATAHSVNRLIVVSFYLINLGFFGLNLRNYEQLPDAQAVALILTAKVGAFALMLGIVSLTSLFILSKISRQAVKTS